MVFFYDRYVMSSKIKFELKSKEVDLLPGRFVAIATKELQTLNLKFDQVMFDSLVFT